MRVLITENKKLQTFRKSEAKKPLVDPSPSKTQLASVAEQAGLSPTRSLPPKTGLLIMRIMTHSLEKYMYNQVRQTGLHSHKS